MSNGLDHIHKLKRHQYRNKEPIYFCTLPECDYKKTVKLHLGKRCICWRCGNPFLMNEYSIRLAKPHCNNCHKNKESNLPLEKIGITVTRNINESLKDRLSKTLSRPQAQEDEVSESHPDLHTTTEDDLL